ncbi:MAG: RNA polymerase sigma factor [Chitinophagaceae bacterium]|nr:RNA polymerase sigma factor [Chitinophagaceae bacterium]
MLQPEELTYHLNACKENSRQSQKIIYSSFYGYAMAICGRYTKVQDIAVEILNDGFLKVFKEIHKYQPAYADVVSSFKGWIRKIMIYTAIDHYRREKKHHFTSSIDDIVYQIPFIAEEAIEKISYDEIISSIQELSPSYRTVFNLFVIEGFSHNEIAEQLGISIGTSKSNLSKARIQIQKILIKKNKYEIARNVI